ncbi:hypothetical protein SAMN02745121_04733 [Nannocystis exedens]|uniref:Myxococcus cysteine-rich repeat-containing protein n=1 Tax=Nannocystis exedens TaxID=54 RepID=A0A1I2BMZ4_9BACT|nr:hypothetical protein [Nannocystis exedens]PCC67924.1 hypothetical protein NAEX_00932 [Nannocystis exedens]SFE56673.1 hypothetical protein SAMN02745121_04733 [Nannocystis exedens]
MSRRVVLLVAASFSCTRPNPLFALSEGDPSSEADDDDEPASGSGGDTAGTGAPPTGGLVTTDGPAGTTDGDPTDAPVDPTEGPPDPGSTSSTTSAVTDGNDTCTSDCGDSGDDCLDDVECSGKLEWLRRSGDAAVQQATDVAVLSDGSVVVVGNFTGELGTAPDVITATTDPLEGDAFILRLDPGGEQVWIRSLAGAGLQSASAVVALSDDRIAVAGRFAGQLMLDPHQVDGVGPNPAFVAVVDPDGASSVLHVFGGDDVAALDLAVAPGDDLVVVGRYDGDILIGADKSTSNARDLFAVGLDPVAGPTWSWLPHSTADQTAHAVAVAPTGDVFIGGELESGLEIADINLLGQGLDGFIAGLDVEGVPQWGAQIGGPGDDRARALAAAPDGSFVVAGVHSGGLDFGEGSLPDPGAGKLGGYIAAFDAEGGLRWARSGFVLGAEPPGIAVDGTGRVVAYLPLGDQPIDLGGGPLGDAPGALLVKLTSAGNFVWGRPLVGQVATAGPGLGVGPAGEIAIAGGFDPELAHDPLQVVSAGLLDVYAGRFLP